MKRKKTKRRGKEIELNDNCTDHYNCRNTQHPLWSDHGTVFHQTQVRDLCMFWIES